MVDCKGENVTDGAMAINKISIPTV